MTITGDLQVMAAGLGHPVADRRVLDAFALVGLPQARDEFQEGGVRTTHYIADEQLAEFIFRDDVLDAVIVHTQPGDGHGAYPAPASLIDGLAGDAERDAVLARFGEPVSTRKASDRFEVDGGFVRFGYVEDRVVDISLMRRAPGS
jgi:hypothetical protein